MLLGAAKASSLVGCHLQYLATPKSPTYPCIPLGAPPQSHQTLQSPAFEDRAYRYFQDAASRDDALGHLKYLWECVNVSLLGMFTGDSYYHLPCPGISTSSLYIPRFSEGTSKAPILRNYHLGPLFAAVGCFCLELCLLQRHDREPCGCSIGFGGHNGLGFIHFHGTTTQEQNFDLAPWQNIG